MNIKNDGICPLCENKKELHLFYYGFFKSEYEPNKWCYLCDDCRKKFLNASDTYYYEREELATIEKTLMKKLGK